jgi:hypothetical protein
MRMEIWEDTEDQFILTSLVQRNPIGKRSEESEEPSSSYDENVVFRNMMPTNL